MPPQLFDAVTLNSIRASTSVKLRMSNSARRDENRSLHVACLRGQGGNHVQILAGFPTGRFSVRVLRSSP